MTKKQVCISQLLGVLFMTVFISSCSSTIEDRAKKQMKITMHNEFKYASEFEISNEEIIFSNDSIFIMLFHIKGKKDNGEIAEGNMEYAYEERSMWAFGHPDVKAWDDYFQEIKPYGKNSVESHLEWMKRMEAEGIPTKLTPFGVLQSASFAVKRKVPSDFSQKCEEYKKEKEQ